MSISWWELTVLTLAGWKAIEIVFWVRRKFKTNKNTNNSLPNSDK